MKRTAVAALLSALACSAAVWAGADEEWQRIEELDTPPAGSFASREQARVSVLGHLRRQEGALREFALAYPEDSRSFNAHLRLAHLLMVRGDLEPSAKAHAESKKIVETLGATAPPGRAPDLAFARISMAMRRLGPRDTAARDRLVKEARQFGGSSPGDRRTAPLLAELATLFDDDPAKKATLLREADALTSDPELKGRLNDDLHRTAQFGRTVEMVFRDTEGRERDTRHYRGKVVVICWFADWSPPAMMTAQGIRSALADFSRDDVQPLGVSLDQSKDVLKKNVADLKLDWPIACDGQGWESPLARMYGINALPTVWVLDRAGKLRTLNVHGDVTPVIKMLLRER